ncbi:MAG: phosphatidylserine decarboxylase family protein [Flavobacteriaceae bacterium]|jgi:phosphatidylserine decarboxylase|nr:phosphatidylserine decarboxylase family protein [Flavobacteriaceae bacterium]
MFHKEGYKIIFISFILISLTFLSLDYFSIQYDFPIRILLLIVFVLILQFFRNPKIIVNSNDNYILSPVDGKIVIIGKVFEPEFFNTERLQVSIFMSPLDVHVTRYPMSGKVIYSKYHPGKYLVAWHPKSSTKNERTSIVIENGSFGKILYRQIAGAIARRIVNYAKVSNTVKQGEDAGFIKFGSRIDLFLPLNTKLNVKINQKVKGGISVIAEN